LVWAGLRPDPRRGADPDRLRAAAAHRADCARPADLPEPRCSPRLGIADVPRLQPWRYDPPVADRTSPPDELTDRHPARELAARWGSYLQHDRRRSPHTVRAY